MAMVAPYAIIASLIVTAPFRARALLWQ